MMVLRQLSTLFESATRTLFQQHASDSRDWLAFRCDTVEDDILEVIATAGDTHLGGEV